MERTLIVMKPDGVQRGRIGDIIERFEQKGFKLVAMKFMQPSKELLEKHYGHLKDVFFFPTIVAFMSSQPVVAMVWEGQGVVATSRQMLGEMADPADCKPGTFQGDWCIDIARNICHGSHSVESATGEIALWFQPEELVEWTPTEQQWIYE